MLAMPPEFLHRHRYSAGCPCWTGALSTCRYLTSLAAHPGLRQRSRDLFAASALRDCTPPGRLYEPLACQHR